MTPKMPRIVVIVRGMGPKKHAYFETAGAALEWMETVPEGLIDTVEVGVDGVTGEFKYMTDAVTWLIEETAKNIKIETEKPGGRDL